MSNTATINVPVTTFVANTSNPATGAPSGPFCTIGQLTIPDGPGGSGPLDASGQVSISGGTISVTQNNTGNNPIKIIFNITATNATYDPLSIVFVQQGINPGDPDGSRNFKDRTPLNQTISFNNQWTLHGGNNGTAIPNWKFYIRVQIHGTTTVGWIDPIIENQD